MFKSGKLWLLLALIVVLVNSHFFLLVFGLNEGEYLGKVMAGGTDYPTYLAKMRLGFNGDWQYINRYTTEPHSPTCIFFFYILLGHLARLFSLDLSFTYHAIRLLLSLLALWVLYGFIKKRCQAGEHLMVLALAVFISGTYVQEIDLAPQFHIYSGMMGFTHYMLTIICLLVFFDSVLHYSRAGGRLTMLKASLSLIVLVVIHPFMVVLAGLVITGTVIASRRFVKALPVLAVCAASCAPLMFYFCYIFLFNPVLTGWRAQAAAELQFPQNFLLYGLGSIMAYFTVYLAFKKKIVWNESLILFVVWLATASVLSCTDLIGSRQQWFFFASLPAAYLSCRFLVYLDERLNLRVRLCGRSVIVWLLLVLMIIPSFKGLLKLNIKAARILADRGNWTETIIPGADMRCYTWLLKEAGKKDVILADPRIGNLIPAFTDSFTFVGHHHETLDYENKMKKTEKFLQSEYGWDEAHNFLAENRINYVIVENNAGQPYAFLQPVVRGQSISVYQCGGEEQDDLCHN